MFLNRFFAKEKGYANHVQQPSPPKECAYGVIRNQHSLLPSRKLLHLRSTGIHKQSFSSKMVRLQVVSYLVCSGLEQLLTGLYQISSKKSIPNIEFPQLFCLVNELLFRNTRNITTFSKTF